MRSEVTRLQVADRAERLAALRLAQDDVMDAGSVAELVESEAEAFSVEVDARRLTVLVCGFVVIATNPRAKSFRRWWTWATAA